MAGHPGFEIQPLLRNRTEELGTGSAFRYLVRRRLEICCEAAGIDEDEALAWTYVHTAMEAGWAGADGDRDGRLLQHRPAQGARRLTARREL